MNFELLKQICNIHSPSGDEQYLTEFLIRYFDEFSNTFNHKSKLFYGKDFKNCLVTVFGQPKTAIFCHIDKVGFTVRYNNQLIAIGSPDVSADDKVKALIDNQICTYPIDVLEENKIVLLSEQILPRGTTLTYHDNFMEQEDFIQSSYLDNSIGIFTLLKAAEKANNTAFVFTTGEEQGGGCIPFLAKFLFENYKIYDCLICDTTWSTNGVLLGKGPVISLRDTGIPRKIFTDRIVDLAEKSGLRFQLEVEDCGGSDGKELSNVPYPMDWCFIGVAQLNHHSSNEKAYKSDILENIKLYNYLISALEK